MIAAYSAGPESDAASVVAQWRTMFPLADIRRGDQQDWLFIVATRVDHEKIRAVLGEILAEHGEEPWSGFPQTRSRRTASASDTASRRDRSGNGLSTTDHGPLAPSGRRGRCPPSGHVQSPFKSHAQFGKPRGIQASVRRKKLVSRWLRGRMGVGAVRRSTKGCVRGGELEIGMAAFGPWVWTMNIPRALKSIVVGLPYGTVGRRASGGFAASM